MLQSATTLLNQNILAVKSGLIQSAFKETICHNISNRGENKDIRARKFVVYQEEAEEEHCDETSDISTLTFLNFVIASLSITASLLSNTNSNANSNNDNNNNNNLNDNNVNIGSNNNNANSENMLTFQPMVGRRRRRRCLYKNNNSICLSPDIKPWLLKVAFDALELFAQIETCNRSLRFTNSTLAVVNDRHCLKQIICQQLNRLKNVKNPEHHFVATHLISGALKISIGIDKYSIFNCA